jgi:hypothetical protein
MKYSSTIQENSPRSSMVERVTSNDEVAGSIPSEGIIAFKHLFCNFLQFFFDSFFVCSMFTARSAKRVLIALASKPEAEARAAFHVMKTNPQPWVPSTRATSHSSNYSNFIAKCHQDRLHLPEDGLARGRHIRIFQMADLIQDRPLDLVAQFLLVPSAEVLEEMVDTEVRVAVLVAEGAQAQLEAPR